MVFVLRPWFGVFRRGDGGGSWLRRRVSVDLAASQDFGGFPVVQAGSAGPGRFVVGFVVLRSAAERDQ